MSVAPSSQLSVVADIVRQFGLASLLPALRVCQALSGDELPLDVAVLGQFKSGKSSLLNAVLGEAVFPVGAVPVTTVITRATAGPTRSVRVTYQNGSAEEGALDGLADFVTEAGNPGNRRQVAVVDVSTPAMRDWPGVRLVDTPGLGSVLAHNTEATRDWMPNVAIALVTVSVERPLSDEDRRLVSEARQTAPRVVVMMTKVDLLTDAELVEVADFLNRGLYESFGDSVSVLSFSSKVQRERYVRQFQEAVLRPVAADVAGERRAALKLKMAALIQACHGYLTVGMQAADRADADRQQLRAAVLNESVNTEVIRDELRLAEQRVHESTRPALKKVFLGLRTALAKQTAEALVRELSTWRGNLAQQSRQYEAWMADRLVAELTQCSRDAVPVAVDLVGQAEQRFRRITEAFRDRIAHNIRDATGVTVSPTVWEVQRPQVAAVPVAVSQAFMVHWDLLWWLLPMWLVGGLFRRHVLTRVSWEVEKNLIRLVGDWAGAVDAAVTDLRTQAVAWVDAELSTLDGLLGQQRTEKAPVFREALRRLEQTGLPHTAETA